MEHEPKDKVINHKAVSILKMHKVVLQFLFLYTRVIHKYNIITIIIASYYYSMCIFI